MSNTTINWTGYIRFDDGDFETLRRAGISDSRIEAMKATRAKYDAFIMAVEVTA